MDNIIKTIEDRFNRKVFNIIKYKNKYYFGLYDDGEIDNTMNIRTYDLTTEKFDLFNAMDDVELFKIIQEKAKNHRIN